MDAVLLALSDANRRTVLEALSDGPATVGELAALLPIARPGVSRHLRVLRDAGLVDVRKEAQFRVYNLRPGPLAEVEEWLSSPPSPLGITAERPAHRDRPRKEEEERTMSEETRETTRITGRLRSVDGRGVVRVEGLYDTDIDDLWSALTDGQRLARWIADVEGDLSLGGAFRATFTSGWEGPGRVDACEPPRRFLVTMTPGNEEETVIEAVLVAEGNQTRLVVEERGIPLEELAAHGAGWQAHLEDLVAHRAGTERTDWRTRWNELTPIYREQTVTPA